MPAAAVQLDPALPYMCLINGAWRHAYCHGWLDYGIEGELLHVCYSVETGEQWTLRSKDIRLQTNLTLGRVFAAPCQKKD